MDEEKIIKIIEKRLSKGTFSYKLGNRMFYGLKINVSPLVWARNLCDGLIIYTGSHTLIWDSDLKTLTF